MPQPPPPFSLSTLLVAWRVYASYIHLSVPSGRGGNTKEPPSKQDPRMDYFFLRPRPPLLYFPLFLFSPVSLPMFFFTPIFLSTSHQSPPSPTLFPARARGPAPAVPWEKLTAVSPENLCECREGGAGGGSGGAGRHRAQHIYSTVDSFPPDVQRETALVVHFFLYFFFMSTKRDSLWLMGRISPGVQHLHLPLFVRQPETLRKKKERKG